MAKISDCINIKKSKNIIKINSNNKNKFTVYEFYSYIKSKWEREEIEKRERILREKRLEKLGKLNEI